MKLRPSHAATALVLVTTVTACAGNRAAPGGESSETVSVSSSAEACELSTTEVPSGSVVFRVRNDGHEATEFYLYDADGQKVVGEVEDIGPGLSRDLEVTASPGRYVAACKPGMEGDGIRKDVVVTD